MAQPGGSLKTDGWWRVFLLVMLCGVMAGVGQDELPGEERADGEEEEGKAEERPLGWLRILAVGDAPPFRQEVRDGVRVELPPPPGSVPPFRLAVPVQGRKTEEMRLKLGVVTRPVVARSGFVNLQEVGEDKVAKDWMRIRMPAHRAALAVLLRDPRKGTWDEPRSILLEDDLQTHPEGALRLVNASVFKVQFRLAGQELELGPGESRVLKGEKGVMEGVPLRVSIQDGKGRWRPVYDSALSQGRGERTNIVVYRADGERPRRPAKVLVLRGRAFLPKLPGKKAEEKE